MAESRTPNQASSVHVGGSASLLVALELQLPNSVVSHIVWTRFTFVHVATGSHLAEGSTAEEAVTRSVQQIPPRAFS